MAFKMKGSPAKLGTIQGTSGYNSALKQMVISREEAYESIPDDYTYKLKKTGEETHTLGKDERKGDLTISSDGKTASSTVNSKGEDKSISFTLRPDELKHHKSILDARWKKANKSTGGNLNDLVRMRNTYTKGTQAWVDAQNKINKSLGSNKVHEVTVKTPKKEKKMLKKEIKNKNKVDWGKGQRNIFGVKKDKSKRNRKTWWNPWD